MDEVAVFEEDSVDSTLSLVLRLYVEASLAFGLADAGHTEFLRLGVNIKVIAGKLDGEFHHLLVVLEAIAKLVACQRRIAQFSIHVEGQCVDFAHA